MKFPFHLTWITWAWLMPAVLTAIFLEIAAPRLFQLALNEQTRHQELGSHIYEQSALEQEEKSNRELLSQLQKFHSSVKSRLDSGTTVQNALDIIRQLAENCGLKVLRVAPAVTQIEHLRVMRFRFEIEGSFSAFHSFSKALGFMQPALYLEEVNLRKSNEDVRGHFRVSMYGLKHPSHETPATAKGNLSIGKDKP